MVGINNITTVTYENITQIANITQPEQFFVNADIIIFGGILYYLLLWCAWFALIWIAERVKSQPLVNAMYASAGISIVAMFISVVNATINGSVYYLLTDYQMWQWPILTCVLAGLIYAMKKI